jgi:hypothetical protein
MPGDSKGVVGVWGVRWQRGEDTTFAIMRVVSWRKVSWVVVVRGGWDSSDRLCQCSWLVVPVGSQVEPKGRAR